MIDKVQIIELDGKPAFAVVPIELWRTLAEHLEDAEDVAAFDRAMAQDDGGRIPHAVVKAELNGAQPVRAWRKYRGMNQAALAGAAGVSRAFICQIEAGERTGSIDTLAAIGRALDVSLDLLQSSNRSWGNEGLAAAHRQRFEVRSVQVSLGRAADSSASIASMLGSALCSAAGSARVSS